MSLSRLASDNLCAPVSKPVPPGMSSPRGDLRAPTLQCSHLFLTELCTFIPRVCCCIGASQPADADAHIGVRLVAVDQSRRAAPPGPSAPGPSARAGSENARSNEAMARGCRVWPGTWF